jgi:hypothetical protein
MADDTVVVDISSMCGAYRRGFALIGTPLLEFLIVATLHLKKQKEPG